MESAKETRFIHRGEVTKQSLGDGAVLVDLRSGNCFELNRTGAEVWDLLAHGADVASICATLASRYNVPSETIANDVRSIVDALRGQKLLEPMPPIDRNP